MNITLMKSVKKPIQPDEMLDLEWEEIVNLLLTLDTAKTKEDTYMFNLWKFKSLAEGAEQGRKYHWDKEKQLSDKTKWDYIPNTIRRCKENAIGVSGIVLDYDGKKSIKDALIELNGIECVIYTTFRHCYDEINDSVNPAIEKFRVILPFTRLMLKEEFERKLDDIKELFPFADNASFSESQAIYLHSAKYPSIAFSKHLQGIKLDPDIFREKVIQPIIKPTTASSVTFKVTQEHQLDTLGALLTCQNVRRGASKDDGGMLTAALICKSVDATFGDFQQICSVILASDSVGRKSETQHMVWNDVTINRITNVERDKFILKYGGTPPVKRASFKLSPSQKMKQKRLACR